MCEPTLCCATDARLLVETFPNRMKDRILSQISEVIRTKADKGKRELRLHPENWSDHAPFQEWAPVMQQELESMGYTVELIKRRHNKKRPYKALYIRW